MSPTQFILTKRKRSRPVGMRQCNVDLPEAIDDALVAHLELTGVSKRDFVLVAVRHEIVRQRGDGLGLFKGEVPEKGRGLLE